MLNPNLLRNNLDIVAKKLALKGFKLDIDKIRFLEKRRKIIQIQTENLQAERNLRSKFIGQAKVRGEDIKPLCREIDKLSKMLSKIKNELKFLLAEIHSIALTIPNLPDDNIPIGKNRNDNVEEKRWGIPHKFDFKIRDHITLGKIHNGLDFSTATKLAGSRFVIMKGQIAHLHRALTQFMLDLHTEKHGYKEIYVPYLVNQNALYGTGQLPRFANELFHVCSLEKIEKNRDYTLIPTAEVPLINLMRNEIINENDLPIKLISHSPCFRSETKSYGRSAHGLIRMHQFDKIEMVQFVHPENSMVALEEITSHAEKVLELLNLPYRRVVLCTGDTGFSACKTYDLEVWIPAQSAYLEISSCSNTLDFQARRIQARYRNKFNNKIQFVHTLNGSGLAVGRTLIAVLENHQQIDGSIKIPEALRLYMKGQQYIC